VKLSGGKDKKYQDYREERELALSRDNIKDKLKKTINTADTETNLISVVQGTDVLLQAGQKVYVIYSTDRIRLVPAN
jgi:Skp family chaperone for outer membrane proteins